MLISSRHLCSKEQAQGAKDFSDFAAFYNGAVDSEELTDKGNVTIVKGSSVSVSDGDSSDNECNNIWYEYLVSPST